MSEDLGTQRRTWAAPQGQQGPGRLSAGTAVWGQYLKPGGKVPKVGQGGPLWGRGSEGPTVPQRPA